MKPSLTPLLLSLGVALARAGESVVHFDSAPAGAPPPHWHATQTGEGEAKWIVVKAEDAPSPGQVLQQSGTASYPVCLATNVVFAAGTLEVKFKAVKGEEDQAAGLVWRAKDARNYYIARANALEGNVRIYKFVDGKRTQFGGVKKDVAAGRWHTLKVVVAGASFKVFLNGEELFAAEDQTYSAAGAVGLWTKADSVTLFDDLRIIAP